MGKRKSQKESSVSELEPPIHVPAPAIPIDGTADIEFAFVMNRNFSKEILDEAFKVYDLKKLEELKEQNKEKFLQEAESQIKGLLHGLQALATHGDLFSVTLQIAVGTILNEVKSSFQKESDYVRWFESNFGDQHIRLFQQSRQLANMGPFAKDHGGLGKNRLLQFDAVRRAVNRPYDEILKEHPLPDAAMVTEEFFSEHVDGIITFERCQKVGIKKLIEFDQAKLMACYTRRAVEVETLKKLKAELDRAKNKKEFLENFVMEKMQFSQGRVGAKEGESLEKRLVELDDYLQKKDAHDPDWVEQLKPDIDEEMLRRIHKFLGTLIKKLQLGSKPASTSKKNKEVHNENS